MFGYPSWTVGARRRRLTLTLRLTGQLTARGTLTARDGFQHCASYQTVLVPWR